MPLHSEKVPYSAAYEKVRNNVYTSTFTAFGRSREFYDYGPAKRIFVNNRQRRFGSLA